MRFATYLPIRHINILRDFYIYIFSQPSNDAMERFSMTTFVRSSLLLFWSLIRVNIYTRHEALLTHLDREASVEGREGQLEACVEGAPQGTGKGYHTERLAHVASEHRDDGLGGGVGGLHHSHSRLASLAQSACITHTGGLHHSHRGGFITHTGCLHHSHRGPASLTQGACITNTGGLHYSHSRPAEPP